MIGALLSPLFGMVGSLASAGGSLASAGASMVKSVFKSKGSKDEVDKEGFGFKKGKGKGDADSGEGKKGKKGKKESSSMFGGLDLGAVESAIQGPMGPAEPEQEVKGGVYKQIFAVNEKMLSSLMNIENSIRLLLSIEYEKIQGMISDDRQTTIDEGETDEPEGEKKKGLLGRAASGIGGMLGSAYSKAKGGLGSNLFKLLGVGALIIAFKKYPEEIKEAVKKTLEFLQKTYEYFTAEDFTFGTFIDDLKTKFLPKIRDFSFKILDFIWGAIKGVASEFLFGAKGDTRIRQESGGAEKTKANTADIMKRTGLKMADLDIKGSGIKQLDISEEEQNKLTKQHQDLFLALNKISRESDGRIQWTGLGNMNKTIQGAIGGRATAMNYNVMDLLNAQPIVDGNLMTMEDLKTIEMNKMAGITRGMTDDKQEEITDALAKKTTLVMEKMNLESAEYDPNNYEGTIDAIKGAFTIGKTGEDYYNLGKPEKIKAIEEEIAKVDDLLKYSGQIFMSDSASDSISGTDGVSAGTQSLATVAQKQAKISRDLMAEIIKEAAMVGNQPGTGGAPIMITNNTDQSSNQVVNHSMSGKPSNNTVQSNMMAYALGLQGSLR